ncbi:MAG: hypothetical protein KJ674_03555 [Nanoarchaeota archaeon]|nr:hypothetical protein [Nanoarchaeota archaeon]
MEVKNWWIVVIIVILLIASIFILVKNYNEGVVGLNKESLDVDVKECCTYIEAGEEKTCSVLTRFSCDQCKKYCS